jgi:hypothetical protein
MKRSTDDILLFQRALIFFEEDADICRCVPDTRAMWELRHELKRLSYRPAVLFHLAELVRTAIAAKRRFRVFDCVKILRAQIVASQGRRVPARVIRVLFSIYRELVLASRPELQWALSRTLRNQRLTDEEIGWLIEHWRESEHLVNRLLRYPYSHPTVVTWAKQCYTAGLLADRKSELLALIIPESGVASFSNDDPVALAWALVRVAMPVERKLAQLENLEPKLPAELIVDISLRLGSPHLIHRATGLGG